MGSLNIRLFVPVSFTLWFSYYIMSNSLRPQWTAALQTSSPSLSPGVCSNSCPLSWCCYLTISYSAILFLLLPSIFASISVFSNDLFLHIRWPKYWSFSFSISPSNKYTGLIFFDWFDLLAVQGTLKILLQHHSAKASDIWCSVFCHLA